MRDDNAVITIKYENTTRNPDGYQVFLNSSGLVCLLKTSSPCMTAVCVALEAIGLQTQLNYTSNKPLGKYGRMRRAFLAENNPILLDDMILIDILFPHLWEIDETARRRVKQVMTELLERNPALDKVFRHIWQRCG